MVTQNTKQRAQTPQPEKTIWLTSADAAEVLGINPRTLENWRSGQNPDQPEYTKFPGKSGRVKYKLEDINAWLESRIHEFASGGRP